MYSWDAEAAEKLKIVQDSDCFMNKVKLVKLDRQRMKDKNKNRKRETKREKDGQTKSKRNQVNKNIDVSKFWFKTF